MRELQARPRGISVRRIAIWALPAAITISWLVYVTVAGQWDRALMHWRSSVTMIFGSFVAGSTPQGGGAVAFPVFTKVLEVPAEVARTFSLCIQAIGMVVAATIILLARRKVALKAALTAGVAGAIGFLVGLFVLGDVSTPFWSFRISPAYVKVTFTIALAALAYIVWLALEEGDAGTESLHWNRRIATGVVLAGLVGGAASALVGSGTDVVLFLFIVVMAGLHPRIGVPSSVIAMAAVSAVGFIVLGLLHGQMDIALAGDQVVAVGGQAISPVPAAQYDVFGLWLAAVPIVVWGAPLGTYFIHILKEGRLIAFVAGMAALEVITTIIFLEPLRTDPALRWYAIGGLVFAMAAIYLLHKYRHRLLGMKAMA